MNTRETMSMWKKRPLGSIVWFYQNRNKMGTTSPLFGRNPWCEWHRLNSLRCIHTYQKATTKKVSTVPIYIWFVKSNIFCAVQRLSNESNNSFRSSLGKSTHQCESRIDNMHFSSTLGSNNTTNTVVQQTYVNGDCLTLKTMCLSRLE